MRRLSIVRAPRNPAQGQEPLALWGKTHNELNRELWRRFVALAKPYWFSEERRKARWMLVLLLLMAVAVNLANVYFADIFGAFNTAAATKDAPGFYRGLLILLSYYVVLTPVVAYYQYAQGLLGLYWRRWMTHDYLDNWLGRRAYYRMHFTGKVDNPDERISQDINGFTADALNYLLNVLGSVITFFAFMTLLWQISHQLMYAAFVYAAGGTALAFWLGRPLVGLNFAQLRKEADFRFGLIHVRKNVEGIALLRGEPVEDANLRRRFMALFVNYRWLIAWQRNLNFFQTPYNYVYALLPYLLIFPLYLAGKVQFGVISQAGVAFGSIIGALTLLVASYTDLSNFAARINRLYGMDEELRADDDAVLAERALIRSEAGPQIALRDVTLQTPDYGRVLVRDLSLAVAPGEPLLVVGPSGVGKSSLLRAVAGLWSAGSGMIERPEASEIMFLPQRPYMALGSLRDNLCYPRPADLADEQLLRLLAEARLEDLPERVGGLDAEREWVDVLSVGEQQRVAFARLLLARPRYAVLDEATSALDPPTEEALYTRVLEAGVTVVSVAHRPSLRRFHRVVLELAANGTWQYQRLPL